MSFRILSACPDDQHVVCSESRNTIGLSSEHGFHCWFFRSWRQSDPHLRSACATATACTPTVAEGVNVSILPHFTFDCILYCTRHAVCCGMLWHHRLWGRIRGRPQAGLGLVFLWERGCLRGKIDGSNAFGYAHRWQGCLNSEILGLHAGSMVLRPDAWPWRFGALGTRPGSPCLRGASASGYCNL